MLIEVGGLDPSLRNFGLARGVYDTETNELSIEHIRTQVTEAEEGKTVRKSSDDLRCASLLVDAMHGFITTCSAVFAEIPSGSQSARGSFSNGICLGVMGSVGVTGAFKGRLIQVNPLEVKRAATGSKHAGKDEMIEWAMKKWPNLPWIVTKSGVNKGQPSPKNEHMADACAAINAGIKTDEFKSLLQLLKMLSQQQSSQPSPISN